jgi:hypothetical protein
VPLVRTVLAVVALGLVGAVAVAVLLARSYAPLEWAGGATGADTRTPSYYDSVQTREEDGEIRTAYVFRHSPGQTLRLGVDLYNGGRFPVRIEGVEPSASGALQVVGLDVQPNPQQKVFRGLRPPPYTLEPHEYVFLVPILRSGATCGPDGASQAIEAIRIRYTYLRYFERTETIELPMSLVQACGDPRIVADGLSRA